MHTAAIPTLPISPRKLRNVLFGTFLGLLFGAGLSLIVDARDQRLLNIDDIRRIYNYTLLGAIPDFSKLIKDTDATRAHNLFVRDRPRSAISETYRMINTNLKFSQSDNLQVIVVSSGMPGEGKSSTLANIALAMAELGNRVLLIDADMRLPSQHQVWELPNRKGLSHVLVEMNNEFSRLPVIPENDNLDVLLAGNLPPNPTALLDSKKFKILIEALRPQYDYVLIDAPPITVASDALLISKVVDGLILVARPGKLNKAAANVAFNTIRQAGVNVLGMIGNGVVPKNEKGNLYYQQEYYGKESIDPEPQEDENELSLTGQKRSST
ncbi:MAG: polysaccharide biosynthesis tyrosine autokinase [Acaryochloridaceae cyanobacterium RL_2_7]|nr:polysaccharide biosynthesis tyrosine autokinase [Acaryochloridaceae cyanobacterium RL_2_7]